LCDEQNPCNADFRIKATFFNAGTPTEGSFKDDISAMIYLMSYSNRPGMVDIRGIVDRVCRAWHRTNEVEVLVPGLRRAEG
jgi:hypothetical protein